ncbi:MAG: ribosome recycling factor [Deltaproteobacteria bacterium]|nr:ribosome recycling factor [Deltaproteobacteria bacterium]
MDAIINDAKEKMEKAISALQDDLAKLRTGRASLVMLDGIKVDYYGTMTPLNQVATLAVPEPRLITVQPWEATLIPAIERAIEKANIGLNPTNDGKIVRLPVPQLTEDRRKEIVKSLKNIAEEKRVSVRQARRDANDVLKQQQKNSEITEDDLKRGQDQVQKTTDDAIAKIDDIVVRKEKDIMTV